MWSKELFETYVQDIQRSESPNQDFSEQKLTATFSTFIQAAFDVESKETRFEKTIRLVDIQSNGRIDFLLGDLAFEFKRAQFFEKADRAQLKRYLKQLNLNRQTNGIGFMTDGLRFEVWEADSHVPLDRFNLAELSSDEAFIKLDVYLFSQTQNKPTASDVVSRFGSSSPIFRKVEAELKRLLKQVEDLPKIEVWRKQWGNLLSRVYGTDVGDDNLFIRHTYLCQFARLIGFATLKQHLPQSDDIKQIIEGEAFKQFGVSNISESDFFSWILIDEIQADALKTFYHLSQGLMVYDLRQIDQDLLKQLYQSLVDPATRHNLGEFYTPDWLAELTLEEITYQHPQSLYDPTCGSGAFLFSAIRRLAQTGLNGRDLVTFAINNIVGTDIHPLAITVARMNYVLALAEGLRSQATLHGASLVNIPVFMANALLSPAEKNKPQDITIETPQGETFRIPDQAQSDDQLTKLIDEMELFASFSTLKAGVFDKRIEAHMPNSPTPATLRDWNANLDLLSKLKREDRNGIWAYVLKNQVRPLVLARRKFDVVAGNPPWLTYRDIQSEQFQKDVKTLYQHYGLLTKKSQNLITQMEMSSLFFTLVQDRYLKEGGTLAFVMPRSVITGAKQHRPFQARGFSRILDFEKVSPLFNVPTCVLIQQAERHTQAIPTRVYSGKLPSHELSLAHARKDLKDHPDFTHFVDSDIRSPYYYEHCFQGATLVPRTLCFVKPSGYASSPSIMTDPEADKDAKVPYKGLVVRGVVHDPYIYATLLSKHLFPFGMEKLHMVALPIVVEAGALRLLTDEMDFLERGHGEAWKFFRTACQHWDTLKKSSTKMSYFEQLNYRNKITNQNPQAPYKVIYNASGTHLAACVVETAQLALQVHERTTQGFIADCTTYSFETVSHLEAHYLCAILNTSYVNQAIKSFQSAGTFGERHVHRTPFEACAIPPFSVADARHVELARLSQEAHNDVKEGILGQGKKLSQTKLRSNAREFVKEKIARMDQLAREVLSP